MNVNSIGSTTALRAMGGPPPPPPGGGPEKTLQAVAERLGTDAESLEASLDGGSTMSSLAAAAGISQEDLVATIAATLPAQGPDGAAVDTTSMATQIANGSWPSPPARPEVDLGQGLDALSSALGISSSDLLERLTSGTGISDLLSADTGLSAQLAQDGNRGALVDGYC
jgi:uncharacterized protein YidB (DUF937 family)